MNESSAKVIMISFFDGQIYYLLPYRQYKIARNDL